MTSEREAKVWLVAAGVLFVWACTMVGCTNTTANGPIVGVDHSAIDFNHLAWTDTNSTGMTLSPETAGYADRGETVAIGGIDSAAVFAPSQPDVILLRSRPVSSPRFDAELSGLSIAQPLVSAKRLLVAAVSMLPPLPTPEWAQATSAVAHAELSDQPVAAAAGWAQRLAFEGPTAEESAVIQGLAMRNRGSVMLPPWKHDPTPTPNVAAAMTADEAKFDSVGLVALVIGAMVLLFGGEAVVLWMLNRRGQARVEDHTPVIDDTEESIFRFPEPIELDAEEPYSRAA